MLFNSYSFIIFFPVVLIVYYILPQKVKKIWLLLASYYFYMSWNIKYGFLIFLSTLITYICGRMLSKYKKDFLKRCVLIVGIVSNLLILFFFKYFTWMIEVFNDLFKENYTIPFTIVLPVGISFYTFQALGYVIDVYRGTTKAEKNFITYALFVSFFPQLVAGPIERSGNLLHQLREKTNFNPENAVAGLRIMLWGYFEKIVIADTIGIAVDTVYANLAEYSGATLLLIAMLFIIQIYCDFSGYSHIAIGAARMLNIKLMTNFRQPYFARSIKEFWQRWHISLSKWFLDYLYIPLGGSRVNKLRKYVNILIVFAISGLWHGANITYVVWGIINGLYQIVAEICMPLRDKGLKLLKIAKDGYIRRIYQQCGTFVLFGLSMIFFRARTINQAGYIFNKICTEFNIREILGGELLNIGLEPSQIFIVIVGIILLFIFDYIHEKGMHFTELLGKKNIIIRWSVYYILIIIILIAIIQTFGKSAAAFLYFQF